MGFMRIFQVIDPKYHEFHPGPDWVPIKQKSARKLPGFSKSPKNRCFGNWKISQTLKEG